MTSRAGSGCACGHRHGTLTSAEVAAVAQMLAGERPIAATLAGIAAPEALWQLCRDEFPGIGVIAGGWDIRARWFGAVVRATPRLGLLERGISVSWRVIAAQIASAARDPVR